MQSHISPAYLCFDKEPWPFVIGWLAKGIMFCSGIVQRLARSRRGGRVIGRGTLRIVMYMNH